MATCAAHPGAACPQPSPPWRLHPQVLPASSSAPKYKFVVPNEYVYKFMKHLVERPFHMRDMSGKLWDCVLIQRKNKASLGRASSCSLGLSCWRACNVKAAMPSMQALSLYDRGR